ncbi:PREDICTED: uncharacterized protein LOC104715064 [Camelina sativa]|uniref:Uncharacterized protein LOC104715064 n=1 Tax=Camelina sativa TaxID=90675 RepID=A0ABM0TSY2_CAMSA|nr:PREDICTED: uncharacterized protein LOC104715064 [Camelina sativa]
MHPNSVLNDLWQVGGRQWDEPKLRQQLLLEDAAHACCIYLPQHQCPDKLVWHYTKDGIYTVKSGYWLSLHLPDANDHIDPPLGNPLLKTKLWKTSLPPKLKHFYWRVLSAALGTAHELNRRGIPIEDTCQRCCQAVESINHMLFQCPYASKIWRLSNLPAGFTFSSSLEDNIEALLLMYNSGMNRDKQHLPFWIGWQIWKSRNDLIFNKITWETSSVLLKATDDVVEWLAATQPSIQRPPRNSPTVHSPSSQWTLPTTEVVKVNFDGSFHSHNGSIGVGWIIHGDKGTYLLSRSSKLKQASNPLWTERLALLHAIQSTWCCGYRKVILEGDCKALDDLLHRRTTSITMENLLVDIRSWADLFAEISFSLVRRECNQVADKLAKSAHYQPETI